MKKEDLKVFLSITICFLIVIMGMIWLSSESRSNQKVKVINKTKQTITDPVSKMEKRLGPGWKKIEMVQGNWYGPYKVKGGSRWKIGQGEIFTKAKGKTYKDGPDVYIDLVNTKKVFFLSKKGKGVVFLKY